MFRVGSNDDKRTIRALASDTWKLLVTNKAAESDVVLVAVLVRDATGTEQRIDL